jgi:hypothetical protein
LSVAGSGASSFSSAQVGVDQQMMMAGVVELDARRRNAHALQAELHGDRTVHGRAVARAK